ncbi:MAG: CHASE2 domain-containing protein [Rhizomicrobium sp.]
MSEPSKKPGAGLSAFFGGYIGFVVLGSALQALFWMALILINPFGISSAADRVSESIFLKFYAFAYPSFTHASARDQILVVLYDEKTGLPKEGEWPLPRSTHAELIRRILDMQPRAVFLDILFDTQKGGDRSQTSAMLDAARGARARTKPTAPVFFASYAEDDTHKLVDLIAALPVTRTGTKVLPGQAYRAPVEYTALTNHYPLTDTHKENGALTAAAALYNAYKPGPFDKKLAPLHPGEDDMLVAWGAALPSKHGRDAKAFPGCLHYFEDSSDRWHGIGYALGTAIFGRFPDQDFGWDKLQPCAYHQMVSAADFFDTKPAREAELERLVEGSYVLIGARVAGIGDEIVSPVNGKLPGVYLHAMALDNLLSFNAKPIVFSSAYMPIQTVLIFLALVCGRLLYERRILPKTRPGAALALAERLGVIALFAILSALFLFVMLIEWHWPPYNWGAVFAVSTTEVLAGTGRLFLILVAGAAGARWGEHAPAN